MRNILYTANYSINWDYFKGLQDWHIYSLYYLRRYCEKHNIELRVIDNSNVKMDGLYKTAKKLSFDGADSWNIATWSSLVAMDDFLWHSDADNFAWVDLDICIIKPGLNIFNYLEKDVMIDYKTVTDPKPCKKRAFVEDMTGSKYEKYCNTSIIMANRGGVADIQNKLTNLNVNPLNSLERIINCWLTTDDGYQIICDEGLMECFLNSFGYTRLQPWPADLVSEVVTSLDFNDFWLDRFSYHFASATKPMIKRFWQERNIYQ